MKCPESDTCPESEGCPHKGEHEGNLECFIGREWTKLTDCPRCIEGDDDLRRKLEALKGEKDAKDKAEVR